MTAAPPPRWLVTWMALTGLLLGGTIAVLIWAVLDLNAHDSAVDRNICSTERTDRAVDQLIVAAGRFRITVPPLTREECP